MPSTITFRRGQVIVVNVPYTDRSGVKPRPALVVSAEVFHAKLPDVIVCPISSQPRFFRRPGPGDCPLHDWRSIGLRHPSTARISKILAVDKHIVKRPLGALSTADLAKVEAGLRQALSLP
ncbi:MAG TPA: type II toxin-antitoxin system PemK/MazF family toxin [Candidatus Methylomirabilis sp.]|nr:type II toxin-antitoxin system PemK/MazF family toxin [Candidatus Methylomirabilis sp.]